MPFGAHNSIGMKGLLLFGTEEQRRQNMARKTMDEARSDAFSARKTKGFRTARENLADLCDPESFVEIDAIVDPRETRQIVLKALRSAGSKNRQQSQRLVDVW